MYTDFEDKILICETCGEEFIFPGKIMREDVIGLDVKEVEKLFTKRDSLEKKIRMLRDKGFFISKKDEDELKYYKKEIIEHSNGFSREAYNYYGDNTDPCDCGQCIMKTVSQHKSL